MPPTSPSPMALTSLRRSLLSSYQSFLPHSPPSSSSSITSPTTRFLHTTPSNLAISSKTRLTKLLDSCPPYPYPIPHTYKQSWFGLYGGSHIQFGNNIPPEERTLTRRTWAPNVKHKKLWSFALGKWIDTRVTTHVLRTIDKVGGLDEYLLCDKPARLKELGPYGWRLRHKVITTKSTQRRFQAERVAMGVLSRLEGDKDYLERNLKRGIAPVKPVVYKPGNPTSEERLAAASSVSGVMYGEVWQWRERRKQEKLREAREKKLQALMQPGREEELAAFQTKRKAKIAARNLRRKMRMERMGKRGYEIYRKQIAARESVQKVKKKRAQFEARIPEPKKVRKVEKPKEETNEDSDKSTETTTTTVTKL